MKLTRMMTGQVYGLGWIAFLLFFGWGLFMLAKSKMGG